MIDTMDKHSCELFLEDALESGRLWVESGAEGMRVEDTGRRICIAYGFTDCEIYAVTSLTHGIFELLGGVSVCRADGGVIAALVIIVRAGILQRVELVKLGIKG